MTMTPREIEDLAEDALNAACLEIQKKLGVESGDVAGLYFSGTEADAVRIIFRDYIKYELSFKE